MLLDDTEVIWPQEKDGFCASRVNLLTGELSHVIRRLSSAENGFKAFSLQSWPRAVEATISDNQRVRQVVEENSPKAPWDGLHTKMVIIVLVAIIVEIVIIVLLVIRVGCP